MLRMVIGFRSHRLLNDSVYWSEDSSISTSGPTSRFTGFTDLTRALLDESGNSTANASASAMEVLPTSFGPSTIVTPLSEKLTSLSVTPR